MKTQIITLFTALVLSTGLAKAAIAAPVNNATYTVVNDISAINKIEVYGNVELYVSDGSADQVKVYNKYYSESALVQSKNGVLRISSYKNEKLVVWVTANDLRSISAFDNSTVKSFGNLSKIELNVDLHNNATAKLNLDAFSAGFTLTDNAKADLTGTANEFSVNRNQASIVNNSNFIADHYTESKTIIPAAVVKEDDLAGL